MTALHRMGRPAPIQPRYQTRPITAELLSELLTCNPETGEIFWKMRGPEWPRSDHFNRKFAGQKALHMDNGTGYLRGAVLKTHVYAHRAMFAIVYGRMPEGQIDHINGNRADNRIVNLREVSCADNCRNAARHKDNTSGRVGVHWKESRGSWRAVIGRKHLGQFPTFEEACAARERAERALGYHENHGREVQC